MNEDPLSPQEWIPILYRDFWDLPRAVVFSHGDRTIYLLCRQDDEEGDYLDHYDVYVIRGRPADLVSGSWIGLESTGTYVGRLPIDELRLDPTRRRAVHVESVRNL